MKDSKLTIHYIYFVPILLVQVISTFSLSLVLPLEMYGEYTLYLTTISLFAFTTLGANLGLILNYRNVKLSKINGLRNKLFGYTLLQLVIFVITLVILKVSNAKDTVYLLTISIFCMSFYQMVRSVFLTSNSVHALNLYTLSFRLIFIIDAFVYYILEDFMLMLIVDVVLRAIISIIGMLYVYNKSSSNNESIGFKDNTGLIKTGLPLMISSLVFSSSLMIDKYALSSSLEELAIYSFAISIILSVRILLKPLNDVLFVKIDSNISTESIEKIFYKNLIVSYTMIILAYYMLSYGFNNLSILSKYSSSLQITAILLLIIPLMIPIESILVNLNKLKNTKLFLLKVIIIAIINIIILFGYTTITNAINLSIFSALVVVCNLVSYIILTVKIMPISRVLRTLMIYSILCALYVLLIV